MDSNFRIKVSTKLDKSGAENEFKAFKNACEAQKITLHINSEQLAENLTAIEKAFKNAFKFDNKQLSNLNSLKTVLVELNTLSKDLQKNIFGSGKGGNTSQAIKQLTDQSNKVKKLASEYDRLKAVQVKLKGQLAGLWQTDSYNEVLSILRKINSETANAKKRLTSAGGKELALHIDTTWADKLTEKFSTVFQSIQRGALTTHQALEKYLASNNLGKEERAMINGMLSDLEKLQTRGFTNKTTYNSLREWLVQLEQIKAKARDLKIDISYNSTAEKGIKTLITDYQKLRTEASNLQSSMSKMRFGSEQYKEYEAQLKRIQSEMKKTFKQIGDTSKLTGANLKIDDNLRRQFANVFSTIDKDIQATKTKLNNMLSGDMTKTQRGTIEKLLSDINKLDGRKLTDLLNLEKPYQELAKMDSKISEVKEKMATIKFEIRGSKSISTIQSEINTLTENLTRLRNSGFANIGEADTLLGSLKQLSRIKLNNLSDNKLSNVVGELERINNAYKQLKTNANFNKNESTLQGTIENRISSLKRLQAQYEKLGMSTDGIQTLVTRLRELDTTDLGNARKSINEITTEMNRLRTNISGKTANTTELSSLIAKYKSLSTQIESTKKNMTKMSFDTAGYRDLEGILNTLENEFTQTGEKIKQFGVNLNRVNTGSGNSLSQAYVKQLNNISSSAKKTEQDLTKLLSGNVTQGQAEALNNLVTKAKELQNISIKDINTANAQEHIAQLNAEMSKLKTNSRNITIEIKANSIDSIRSHIDGAISSLQRLNKSTKGLNSESINNLIREYERLKQVAGGSLNESGLKQLQSDLTSANEKMKQVVSTSTRMKELSMANINMNNLISELNRLQSQFEKLGRDSSEVNALKSSLESLDRTDLNRLNSSMQTARERISQFKSSIGQTSAVSSGIRKSFSDLYATVQGYSIGFMVGNALTRGIMEAKQTLLELDEAFVSFKKVAPDGVDTSSEALDRLQQKASEVGKTVASSSVDMIKGTASALQAGMKNVNSALEYAKNVNMYKNVADISMEDSDKYLKTTMSVWGGVNNSLKPIHENLKNATTDYSTMTKYMDLANYAG